MIQTNTHHDLRIQRNQSSGRTLPPLAMMLNPEIVSQAHARMSSRVPCVVYRPLDKPRLSKADVLNTAGFDKNIDGSDDESIGVVDEVDWLDGIIRKLPLA